ncbi:MAG: MBL fold metallo-hydrolase [Firmicutes bacterium HGW-Firmicutes-16]|nr:MAG: MBL fold metallo-hydrolase [Firmicutes bacterium HGW-Firmicutes-16]
MFELVQVGPQSYYIMSPAKIGIYKPNETDVYLIDSGNDKDAGRKVRKILDEKGWTLKAIINTHSNADHIGGNRYLQQQYGCPIYAKGIEADFTRHPVLEPSFLYGGYPLKELRHKFLLAEESDVLDISDEGFPQELEVISLPGHFFDMIGIRTPDGTAFLADCISSRETLEKYRIAFIYDVAAYLETLDRVEAMEAKIFVPAHTEACSDLKELIEFNRTQIYEIADRIVAICETPQVFESILKQLFDGYGLAMSFEQYVLVGSTVRSYLSWLKDTGKVWANIESNCILWEKL